MYKNIIKNTLKFSLAIGLIYWLLQSGKLDFKLLQKLIETPFVIIASISLMQFDHLLVALRLRIILSQRASKPLSFIRLFISNWIGIFFNSVLPGSVTGDIVKIFYIKNLDENFTKKFLIASVFIDRIVGLIGLVLIGGIVSIINFEKLTALSKDVSHIIQINIILLIVTLISLITLFFLPNIPYRICSSLKKITLFTKVLNKLEAIWTKLLNFKNKLLILILTSIIIQSIAIYIFWYLVHPFAQGGTFTLATAFSIMPIGFTSLAIPIAPAGLGVGHVIFQNLLGYFQITNGASLFNIYFFVMMFSNLTGVLPYIFYSAKGEHRLHLKDIE